jgi:hypothetical protein
MKVMVRLGCLAVAGVLLSIVNVEEALSFKSVPNYHRDLMREALCPLGFKESAIQLLSGVSFQLDALSLIAPFTYDFYEHFDRNPPGTGVVEASVDALAFARARDELFAKRLEVLRELEEGHTDRALERLGLALHALQDFYSHSNWVDLTPLDKALCDQALIFGGARPESLRLTCFNTFSDPGGGCDDYTHKRYSKDDPDYPEGPVKFRQAFAQARFQTALFVFDLRERLFMRLEGRQDLASSLWSRFQHGGDPNAWPFCSVPTRVTKSIQFGGSWDPNDKTGSEGAGAARYMTTQEPLHYAIHFENLATATAPAYRVVVTDTLDPATMDLNSISFEVISFADKVTGPVPGATQFMTDVDLRPEKNISVRISASVADNLLTCGFVTIDTTTGEEVQDALSGFLPPNGTPPEGEGSVVFSVMPRSSLSSGTEIKNRATIEFDANPPMNTAVWSNTIDNAKPTSRVLLLPTVEDSTNFSVTWSGTDLGSGIADYSVFVSEDGGPFTPWLTEVASTSESFLGQAGKSYAFYTVARDLAGNVEDPQEIPSAITRIASGVQVTGIVRSNCDQTAVGGAVIALSRHGTFLASQTTSTSGAYAFTAIPDVGYRLTIWPPTDFGCSTPTCDPADFELTEDRVINFGLQPLTVRDATPPSISAPPTVTAETGPDANGCGLVLADTSLGAATATDNCVAVGVTRTGVPAGNLFPVGTTTVTYTATDATGNTASATQVVTVIDKTSPTIAGPASVNVATGPDATACGIVVSDSTLGMATASDNCTGVVVARSGLPVGNAFPVGTTTVTYTATDAGNNLATATQTVTVVDNTQPELTAPADFTLTSTVVPVPASSLNLGTPTTSDNCGAVTVTNDAPASYPAGTTLVHWAATDSHNNQSYATQSVTITQASNLNASILVYSALHTIGQGSRPSSRKTPLALNLKVFPKLAGPAPDPRNYGTIWNSGPGLVPPNISITGPTIMTQGHDPVNLYTILVASGASYLVIGQAQVTGTGAPTYVYVGSPTDKLAPNSTTRKHLHVFQEAYGECVAANTEEEEGSLLLISQPEYLEFTSATELLPIVYESVEGDWSVTVEATPPQGFTLDQPSLSVSLTDSTLQTVQFTLTDVGSTWSETRLTHHIRHRGRNFAHAGHTRMVNKRDKTPRTPGISSGPSASPDYVPTAYRLFQNFPDPFNPTTTLQFDLPEPAVVSLKIYNVVGQEVAALLEKRACVPGRHRVIFNGTGLGTGIYFYRLEAGPYVSTKRMLLMK